MKFRPTVPPRTFEVGRGQRISMTDCGRVALEPDELVTFTTPAGAEYDLARKSWGFYATPSLNGRLAACGLRAVLVANPDGKYYVFLLERGKEDEFDRYLAVEQHRVVAWLDTSEALAALERRLS